MFLFFPRADREGKSRGPLEIVRPFYLSTYIFFCLSEIHFASRVAPGNRCNEKWACARKASRGGEKW